MNFLDAILNDQFLTKCSTNLYVDRSLELGEDQSQTMDSFSFKWKKLNEDSKSYSSLEAFQQDWFLKLYGFESESILREYLKQFSTILDAGAGKGYKAAWMAKLAPHAQVYAVDISESILSAAEFYKDLKNITFIRGDIGSLSFLKNNSVGFVYCDQVIMHTTNPASTFKRLSEVVAANGELLTYVYRKKALPRELVDDYFRKKTHSFTNEEMLEFSEELTRLGRFLDKEVPGEYDFPEVKMLGIKPGKMSVQRFLYWNFLKCFWNDKFGEELSVLTNFDWYSPSQAARFSKDEFLSWPETNKLKTVFFHEEEACYTGRFLK
jgi:2-polyprenyl-3-methyl-5-hydroxy-6-metoxy-1,4-benzoquinol methylase